MRGWLSVRPDLLRATNVTNTGCHAEAAATEALFVKNFSRHDYVVAPSGSCVHQVRAHLTAIEQTDEVMAVRERTFELTEFLHDTSYRSKIFLGQGIPTQSGHSL